MGSRLGPRVGGARWPCLGERPVAALGSVEASGLAGSVSTATGGVVATPPHPGELAQI